VGGIYSRPLPALANNNNTRMCRVAASFFASRLHFPSLEAAVVKAFQPRQGGVQVRPGQGRRSGRVVRGFEHLVFQGPHRDRRFLQFLEQVHVVLSKELVVPAGLERKKEIGTR